MQKRALGRTGHKSTLVTLGGAIFIYPISEKHENDFIKYAMDKGINHIDVAPTYGDAEERMGKWVKEYRDNIYLACKTRERTREKAHSQLKESLKKLQTDYFDLYQFHGLDSEEELNTVLGENGALEAVLEAKEEGMINHIGITSHNPENIMLALERFAFDTVLLPVNYVLEAHPEPKNDYRPVLEIAKERDIGIIAMKSGAKGPWPSQEKTRNTWYQPFETRKEIEESVVYTLSQTVTTVASSSDIGVAKMMIEAAENFAPMDASNQKRLIEKALEYKPLFPRR
jgi:aryl-alcohol dehydrogenase-like predicted oxidoreductase